MSQFDAEAIMYLDNSLIPKEAIRLAALGTLARGPMSYADLSREVRQFAARIVGPSLDLLGTSIELLKFEGLIAPGDDDIEADLVLTDSGQHALYEYMTSSVRPGVTDLNKLVVALKLRFIDVLAGDEQRDQLEQLQAMYEGERVRLHDLAGHGEWQSGHLAAWIAMEITQVEGRIAWCQDLIAQQP
jgi:hypothetical protein